MITFQRYALLTASAMLFWIPAMTQSRFLMSKIEPASSSQPSPRSDHLAVVINSGDGPLLVIHGGRDHNGPKSDTWTYLVSKNQWTLLAPRALLETDRPPPVYGAVGGYRFVEGKASPFLYVLFGMTAGGRISNEMWVMNFKDFGWSRVSVTGDIPEARYGAIGSLERFVKPDGSVESALIISHGVGFHGLLSDTYKCSFHETDPFRASWKLLRSSVSQLSTREPHPMWKQASTFTANRDLVVFGGCYASQETGGRCPHSDVWLLQYKRGIMDVEAYDPFANASLNLSGELRPVLWRKVPSDPGPRLGASMSQGLSSFEGAYENHLSTVVLYGGSHTAENMSGNPFILSPDIDGSQINIFSTQALAWIREHVGFVGPPNEGSLMLSPKNGMSMNVVRYRDAILGTTDEFYLLFGGQDKNNSFSPFLLKLSFDAFVQSDVPDAEGRYVSRPLVHGLTMFLSWGLMMEIGVVIIRYGGQRESRPRFVLFHVFCELLSLLLAWVGIGIVRKDRQPSNPSFLHARLGTGLVALAMFQGLGGSIKAVMGWVKRGNYTESQQRNRRRALPLVYKLLTATHRIIGLLLLLLGGINILLGLFLILSPTLLWIHWIVLCVLLVPIITIVELGRERDLFKHREPSRHVISERLRYGIST